MSRSKTISDKDVLDRLLTELETVGPTGLSFARAAGAAGLSAATLVQRFGTRDAMVEAVLLHAWDRLDQHTAAADADSPTNPAGAIALLLRLMPDGAADGRFADGLLLLREDFRNPALRRRGAAWGETLARALGRRLTDDVAQAERLGWQMANVWQGALIWWAFKRDTAAAVAVRSALTDWCRGVGAMQPARPLP